MLEIHWNTPVLHDGYLYAFSGRNEPDATWRCVELKSGRLMSRMIAPASFIIAIPDCHSASISGAEKYWREDLMRRPAAAARFSRRPRARAAEPAARRPLPGGDAVAGGARARFFTLKEVEFLAKRVLNNYIPLRFHLMFTLGCQ